MEDEHWLSRKRRSVAVVPHPDDEFFMAGLLEEGPWSLKAVAWLSCGGVLSSCRRTEMARQMAKYKKKGVACYYGGFPDRWPADALIGVISFLEEVVLENGADLLITTAPEGGHRDHDATYVACSRLVASGVGIVTVPCYAWRGTPRVATPPKGESGWHKGRWSSRVLRRRLAIAAGYPSQWFALVPLCLFGLAVLGRQSWRIAAACGLAQETQNAHVSR
jgi:LmbE family N-acetylglucosaminyl deacetylase